ncbi:tryptophan synthase subunit alpha [Synechococcus sp. PCC 7336]|uniref:tryptophan synthase subunit alpha n=1 Tax=Synechococcus sp. PCC 7336 TaxID=195250 RepID=UPI0003477265|nr:tryptophan synthase subunit alpha [Synechococcus sp. PCC 7336]
MLSTPLPTAIAQRFQALKARGEKALIPYITAGDPDLATTFAALKVLDANGADILELGVPYSDPLADGPVIQAAATRSLSKGTRLEDILAGLPALGITAPIVLFTYFNPILRMGIPAFMQRVKESGCSGLVVPDLPLEESQPLLAAAAHENLNTIMLVAPTSPVERMQEIANRSSGFIYLVSTTGVTGMRERMASRVQDLIGDLSARTELPIAVGFGISGPQQAHQVIEWGADAAVVGSAFVKRLADADSAADGLASIGEFCRELKAALAEDWTA